MTVRLFLKSCLLMVGLLMQDTKAAELVPIDLDEVIICPLKADNDSPPPFNEPECETVSAWTIDPQNTALWVKAQITIPPNMLNDQQPHGIYVFGKTSSRVYFNGEFIGQNGTPSVLAKDEFPGKIDAVFYVPASLIQAGTNQIELQLSSHHGFLSLGFPITFIGFGAHHDPSYFLQRNLGLSLIPLGALVLGALYFLVASFNPVNRQANVLFLLMSFLAACQLLAEISRSLFSYSYPFHDVRLLLIVSFSAGFGSCLLRYMTMKLELSRQWAWTFTGVVITLLAVIATPGFDAKTTMAIMVPTSICTGLIAYQLLKQPGKELMAYLAVFLVFTSIIIINLTSFHDVLFYYIITIVLCFLFVQQALNLNREQKQIAKLRFKLEQMHQPKESPKLTINSAGKIELIDSDHIAYCQAAGDYVDLYLAGGKQKLFSGSLKELETQVPDTFLRVHRSYLVNMDYIQSLSSKSAVRQKSLAGGGFLLLSGGFEVPVSRRIMPMVRSAILSKQVSPEPGTP